MNSRTNRLHCYLFAAILLLCSCFAHSSTTTLTGTIVDEQGNPLNGTLTMKLPFPAQDQTTNVAVTPTIVSFNLVNGAIVGGPPLFDVANLQPQGLYYIARAYDTTGALQFYGNYVVTGTTFNLGAATPTSVQTSNVSYVLPIFPNQSNDFTASQKFSTITSESAPVAGSGWVRSASSDQICWRNATNVSDLCLGPTSRIGTTDYLAVPNLLQNGIPVGPGGIPTIANGAGVGAGGNCTLLNAHDHFGTVVCGTGTSPSANTGIFGVTFSQTWPTAGFCTFSPATVAAGAIGGVYEVATLTGFSLLAGASALTGGSTVYTWNYLCNGY